MEADRTRSEGQEPGVFEASYPLIVAKDAAGNRTSKQTLDFTEGYAYDPLYQLTGVERTGGSAQHWRFGYDPVGNRLFDQVGDSVASASYNEKNQLLTRAGGGSLRWRGQLDEVGTVTFTSATVNGKPARMLAGNVFEAELDMQPGTNLVTLQATDASSNTRTQTYRVDVSSAGATYSYDPNGNLETKTDGSDLWHYYWNAENRLTKVEKNSVEVARFSYDPRGRRVEKVASGVTTAWTYDAENILRETSPSVTYKYIQGRGIDEPLAREAGTGARTYYHADALGSIVKLTDASGAVVQTRQYDAWGNLEVGADQPGYSFTGREWDPETGLYYYRARYYDPKIGRFMSEDPLKQPGTQQVYRYVSDNPGNLTDPWGLKEQSSYTETPTGEIAPSQKRLTLIGNLCPKGYRHHGFWTLEGLYLSEKLNPENFKEFYKIYPIFEETCKAKAQLYYQSKCVKSTVECEQAGGWTSYTWCSCCIKKSE